MLQYQFLLLLLLHHLFLLHLLGLLNLLHLLRLHLQEFHFLRYLVCPQMLQYQFLLLLLLHLPLPLLFYLLLFLELQSHILFVLIIFFVKLGTPPTFLFFLFYLIAAFLQVAILLYLAQFLVYWMWKRGTDPDNATIPYLTAIGDLVGTSLLAGAFVLLEVLGDQSLAKLPAHGHADHHDIAHNITEVVTTTLEGLVHL